MGRFVLPLVLLLAGPAWADDGRGPPPAPDGAGQTAERPPAEDREEDFAVDVDGNLYGIDCLAIRYRRIGRVEVPASDGRPKETPTLCDLASTADGYLYGISDTSLYLINLEDPTRSVRVGDHGLGGPWGMSAAGGSLVVNTRGGQVYLLDRKSGEPTLLGPMGGGWAASGDIAFVGDRIVSSVKDPGGQEHLVELDPRTGKATPVGPLRDGQGRAIPNVFGLIDRQGQLFGVTSSGDILRIDPRTARCQVLLRTGIPWWGASSYTRI